jgi:hypothetical protein
MTTQSEQDVEQLALLQLRQRRVYDRIWTVLTAICILGGGVAWLITRQFEHFGWGLFFAIFTVIGLVYNHWFLFRKDPIETQKLQETLLVKHRSSARRIGFVNGTIMMLFSPVILCVAVGNAASFLESLLGVLAAVCLFSGGLTYFLWAKRTRP